MANSDHQATDLVSHLNEAVKQNPISAALIGAGCFWWLLSSAREKIPPSYIAHEYGPDVNARPREGGITGRAQAVAGSLASQVSTVGSQVKSLASQAGDSVSTAASDAAGVIKGAAEAGSDVVRDSAGSAAQASRHALGELLEEQPLVLGVLGVAVGAALAAAVPASETERDLFGSAANSVQDEAAKLVSQVKDNVGASMSTMTQQVKAAGLGPS